MGVNAIYAVTFIREYIEHSCVGAAAYAQTQRRLRQKGGFQKSGNNQ